MPAKRTEKYGLHCTQALQKEEGDGGPYSSLFLSVVNEEHLKSGDMSDTAKQHGFHINMCSKKEWNDGNTAK